MERFAALLGILTLLNAPVQLLAKGNTVRITIRGGDLAAPVEISDSNLIMRFHVWSGPGTSSNEAEGLIVDWSRGVAQPPVDLQVYEVSFLTTRGAYVVSYVIDPSTNEGYVYLPGKRDAGYRDNVGLIFRGVEGNWFHAWSAWEKLAHPLIAKTRKMR